MSEKTFIEQFANERNIRNATFKGYNSVVNNYCRFSDMCMEDLIREALDEEDNHVPLRKRKLKQRLTDYRSHLISKGLASNSIKIYMSKVKTVYRHFEVEIPRMPHVVLDRDYESNFDDLPTKKDLRDAVRYSGLGMKAVILFMSSSGCAKAETLSLTVGDFINACRGYYHSEIIGEILEELSAREDVVPTFYLKRIKTDKYYYTFCSPEASGAIVEYLFSRRFLHPEDRLFDFTDGGLTDNFQKINDDLGMGWVGKYRFFRSHNLRKFHASNIGLNVQEIDELQGRGKTPVHESYIKTNPESLKIKYVEAMGNVMIFNEETGDSKIKVVVNIVVDGHEINLI